MTNGEWQPEMSDPASPPIEPMDLVDPVESKWPTGVGVTSIVFGGLGLLCYGCQSLSTAAQPFLLGAIPEDQRPPAPQGVQLVFQVVQLCLAWVLSVWLLVGGIGLVRRRAWARGHLVAWSFAKIVLTLVSTVVGLLFLDALVQQINDQMSAQGPSPFTFTRGMMIGIMVVSLVWFFVWPVFLILWLGRASVKDEVERWAAESRAAI
jgi:hypothetical protein